MAMTATKTYAGTKRILDADSHVMELPGWLSQYADARTREILRPLELGAAGAAHRRAATGRRETPCQRGDRPDFSGPPETRGLATACAVTKPSRSCA